jgi:hypothetical protein
MMGIQKYDFFRKSYEHLLKGMPKQVRHDSRLACLGKGCGGIFLPFPKFKTLGKSVRFKFITS